MTTKLALVTGGNGFVGCHVVRALLARGDRVRVLARENADLSALRGLPVEIVRGDLRYFDSVERAVNGCNEVYHVAADYRLWLTDPAPMYATNVEGTRTRDSRRDRRGSISRSFTPARSARSGIPHGGVGREDTPSSLADDAGSLQAIEVHGGAGGARGRARGRAGRDRESVDADWRTRLQADADRPNYRGFSESADARVRRDRAQHRRCRRCRARSSARGRAGPNR